MIIDGALEGKFVNLKSVTEEDAQFTLEIRQIKSNNDFIPSLDIGLEQQIDWIRKSRSSADDYFFVVWDKNNNRIGTIGLYNITDDCCESGRIVILGNPFQNIEAQILLDDFGFRTLKMTKIISYIYSNNERALRFSKQFGGFFEKTTNRKDGRSMLKKINTSDSYEEARKKIVKMIYRTVK